MTGFGRGSAATDAWHASVEISSVNRKQAEVVVQAPRELAEIDGHSLVDIGTGEWGGPQLRSMLKSTFSGTAAVDSYEMDLLRPGHKAIRLVLNAHLLDYDGTAPLVVLTILLGIYPAPLLDVTAASVKKLVANYELAIKAATALAGQ